MSMAKRARTVNTTTKSKKRASATTTTDPTRRAPKRALGRSQRGRGEGARERQLEEQLSAVSAIGQAHARCVGLDALFEQIVPNVSILMHAERTTLFLYDAATREIWSKVAEGAEVREIRLGLGQGIAGWVAEHRRRVNIGNAYSDARFNPEVDARTGFRTQSVAAVPILHHQGQMLGVLQVLNHAGGPFEEEHFALLEAIAIQTAYAVENAQLAQHILDQNRELELARARAEQRSAELDLLYQLERETSASTNVDELLNSIVVRACAYLHSEAGSVLLHDDSSNKLFFRAVSGPRKDQLLRVTLNAGEGVVGWVAEHGEPLIVNEPAGDPRHEIALASKIDYHPSAILAVPLSWDHRVIGALEVLNPLPQRDGTRGYDLGDLKLLTLIAGQVASALTVAKQRSARLDTERLAAVGGMLAGVAHDLRNPMTVISGYAQLMAEEGDATARRNASERIVYQVDEMTGMIADLLAFSRGDSRLHPSVVSLPELVGDIGENLKMQCTPRGINLHIDASPGSVVIDAGRTKRIIYNLAKNGIEALKRGGHLTLKLGQKGHDLDLEVNDDGPGIAPEVRARIFEPFVSAGKPHGTGLGLSIVKRFVEDHRGQVTVDSQPGRGTTFSVRLCGIDPATAQVRGTA